MVENEGVNVNDGEQVPCPPSPSGTHEFDVLNNFGFKADFYCRRCLLIVPVDYSEILERDKKKDKRQDAPAGVG